MLISTCYKGLFHQRLRYGLAILYLGLAALALSPVRAAEIETPVQDRRSAEQTYLTLPEWFIVYISRDYATSLKTQPPSAFPYVGYVKQFWQNYWLVYQQTKSRYPFNTEYHVAIMVIGVSTSLEYLVKGLYENTLGRATESLRTHGMTQEDKFAYQTAQDYVDFIEVRPWYEFEFNLKLKQLWTQTDLIGPDMVRKLERKGILSAEYGIKSVYAWLIKKLTQTFYAAPSDKTMAWVDQPSALFLSKHSQIEFLHASTKGSALVALPRYQLFTSAALLLAENRLNFREIAGNTTDILLTVLVSSAWQYNLAQAKLLAAQPILIQPQQQRLILQVQVPDLNKLLLKLQAHKAHIEHIYDY